MTCVSCSSCCRYANALCLWESENRAVCAVCTAGGRVRRRCNRMFAHTCTGTAPHAGNGILKFSTFGGLGIWTIIDVIYAGARPSRPLVLAVHATRTTGTRTFPSSSPLAL